MPTKGYKPIIVALFVSLALSLTALIMSVPQAIAAEEAKSPAAVLEGARQEGKLVMYGSNQVNEAMPMIRKFEGKYPFIKAEFVRLSALNNLNRIITEEKAGKYVVDVTAIKLSVLIFLKAKGLLAKYDSPEHRFYAPNVRDPEGYWTAQYISSNVVGYNTRLVKPADVPKDYEGLLNPKWKGNIGLEIDAYEWFTGILEIMGREQGIAYVKKLARQQPSLRSGSSLLGQLLAAGEVAFTVQNVNQLESLKKEGAPVEWAKFDFPAPSVLNCVSILAKAPHPNAARLFYDFLLSKENAEYLSSATVNKISARTGVKPAYIPKDYKFYPLSEAVLTHVQQANMKEFDKIVKGR